MLRGITNAEHHARPEWSKSQLWALRAHGPVWFYEQFIARSHPPFESEALARGTLVHLFFEIGEAEFRRRAVSIPEEFVTASGALSISKGAAAWRADQPEDAILVAPQDWAVIEGIHRQARENPAAAEILDSIAETEVTVVHHRDDGHSVRGRIDAILADGRIVDWKTTRDARPLDTWQHAVLKHGYHYQAALYESLAAAAGISDEPLLFVALSTTPSYQVQVITLPRRLVDRCHALIAEDLDEIALRMEMGNWLPLGYGEVNELVFPEWAFRD